MSTQTIQPRPPKAEAAQPQDTGMFRIAGGKNVLFTFMLVSSLFLLWGFGNGMIDVMDKHFQDELGLTLAQSANVQFAHYLGYFLMAFPAGWLAIRLGYKGGLITGLLLVAIGGFWFIPATHIKAFWAFLLGVCTMAAGFTFLETIANPYTTVLGNPRYASTRINLAQSLNGIGWMLGPIAARKYIYTQNEAGQSTGSETLWIPYVFIAVVVLFLAVIFFFAYVPDIKADDDTQPANQQDCADSEGFSDRKVNRPLTYILLLLNGAVLSYSCGMIIDLLSSAMDLASKYPKLANLLSLENVSIAGFVVLAIILVKATKNLTNQSIWSHPHFSAATLTQFLYVAAQAGIFSYFINYMTSQVPTIPDSWHASWINQKLALFGPGKDNLIHITDGGASLLASVGFGCFLAGRFSGAMMLKRFSASTMLGLYGALNVLVCLLVFAKQGWFSVAGVFLSYFFMSIMFPTIFALGIHGLGVRAKEASGFIVMAIMGGAILPKVMGHVGDTWGKEQGVGMSRAFIVPMCCFIFIALYGFAWPLLSNSKSQGSVKMGSGH